MVRIATSQSQSEEWPNNDLTPYAKEELRKNNEDSRFCHIHMSGRGQWEVTEGKTAFPLDMQNMKCKCGRWQLTGIPCKHACRVINNNRLNPRNYVSEYYTIQKYKATYELNIKPMPDPSQWTSSNNVPVIAPPEVKRTVGRPPRNRRRELGEQRKGKRSVTLRCSKCNELGHNVLTCMGGLTAAQKKEKGGTKRKGVEEGISSQDGVENPFKKTKKTNNTKKGKKVAGTSTQPT